MISSEFKKRLITSIVLIPLVFSLIIFNKIAFILLLLLIFFLCLKEWCAFNKNDFFINLCGVIFISISLFQAYYLRGDHYGNIHNLILLHFLFIILVCIMSDMGGYIIGKTFGKTKLTSISPKKTYEGSFGSFCFAVIPVFLLELTGAHYNYWILFEDSSRLLKWIFYAIFLSIFCQIGDILMSFFKRKNKLKNTGSILPGHGGILDRIDGLLLVLIVSALYDFLFKIQL